MDATRLVELASSYKDLEIAENAVKRMSDATQFSSFYEAWQDFLHRVERAWEMAERALRTQPGFQQWFSPYAKLKKGDPLLRFIDQARDAEMHGVSDTLDKPIHLKFEDALGRAFKVDSIKYELRDGRLVIDIDTPDTLLTYKVSVLPTRPKLVRFKNRSNWYNPPKSHLGNRCELEPVEAARQTLSFYKAFLEEASSRFGEGKKN